MRKRVWLVALGTLMSVAAFAQESEERTEPVRRIRVLENPYDIASFYRSSQGYGFMESGGPADPYSIASYYRSRTGGMSGYGGYGYSRFWSHGYSRGRGVRLGYGRPIGENGELCLFAPAFLAPVGPLTGVFVDGR